MPQGPGGVWCFPVPPLAHAVIPSSVAPRVGGCKYRCKGVGPSHHQCCNLGTYMAQTESCVFKSDNMAVFIALNKRSAKDARLAHLLRCLFFLEGIRTWSAAHPRSYQRGSGCTFSQWSHPFSLFVSTDQGSARQQNSESTHQANVHPRSQLDLSTLEGVLSRYFAGGIASTTAGTYTSAKSWFVEFCRRLWCPPNSTLLPCLFHTSHSQGFAIHQFKHTWPPSVICRLRQAWTHPLKGSGIKSTTCYGGSPSCLSPAT